MDATHGLDKGAVKAAIAADPPGFYGPLLDGELRRDGSGRMKAACPFHADADPSLTVFADGTFHCFGCSEHGDGLDFLGKRLGLDFPDALREAAGRLGLAAQPRAAQRTPATRYKITDEAGEVVAEHCRQDLPGGEKTFWWQRNGARGLGGLPTADLPLYNLPALLAAEPGVLVVLAEGEKATDALTAAGQLAVGTVCGAKVTPSDAALRPLVGRIVALWPDADEPGETHMAGIAARLQALGCEPFRVTWADAPEKGDAADFMMTHSADELQDLLATAKPMAGTPTSRRLWTAADLRNADFPEPVWIVPDILPEGLTILGGKPKLGKSWLAMQLALAAGTGGRFLDYTIAKRRVLFLALEDSKRRLQSRMRAQGWPDLSEVFFLTECGTAELEGWLDKTQPDLLVVDTLSRFFNLNQSDVQPVTEALGQLQTLSLDRGLSALVNDHHHKSAGEDAIADLLGSTGKGACADTVWGLYRERGQHDARLSVLGRDVEEEDLRLRWDPRCCCWQVLHDSEASKYTEVVLAALADGPAGVSAVSRATGVNRGTLHDVLGKLVRSGRVYQDPATKEYGRAA